MSMYLQNLNANIHATINRGGVTFRKDAVTVDMLCQKVTDGYQMKFIFDNTETYTTIKAKDSKEVAKKLPAIANEIFRSYTLKGMM